MKCFLQISFLLMLFSSFSGASAIAQTKEAMNMTIAQEVIRLTPADLATFAYRGYFKSQGISGYGGLIQDHSSGKVSNKDIVQAAIAMHLLPDSTLNNRGYLNALDNQLREINLH